MADRTIVNALLVMLGVENPGELAPERAEKKLKFRLEKNGVPAGITPEQQAVITELGIKPADLVKGQPASKKEKPAKGKSDASGVKHVYILKGDGQQGDRIEELTEKAAATRNTNRTDARRWEIAPEGTTVPAAKEPEKPATPVTEKAAPKEKGAKKPQKKGGNIKQLSGGLAEMRKILEGRKSPIGVDELKDRVTKAGCAEPTFRMYLSQSKRLTKFLGFLIKVEKDSKGNKVVSKK